MNKKFTFKNGGIWYNQMAPQFIPDKLAKPKLKVNKSLDGVPREEADLEAEKGEIIMIPAKFGGIPATYKIGGKRHYEGGTPLKAPNDSFIFSDTSKMRIKDQEILGQFGATAKKGKKGYTPAELAEKYDINEFVKILADPNSDNMSKKTAELMIKNYNLKLAKLGLVQESMKGFPQGIPAVSIPYMMQVGTDAQSILPQMAQGQLPQGPPMSMGQYQQEIAPTMADGGEFMDVDYDAVDGIISAFADLTGMDYETVAQQIQNLSEEEQTATLQQMAQALTNESEEDVYGTAGDYMYTPQVARNGGSLQRFDNGGSYTDDDWIRALLTYEKNFGSPGRKPHSTFGWNNTATLPASAKGKLPTTLDEAVKYFKESYLPKIKDLPLGLRERIGSYIYNSNRSPEHLLLYVNGDIDIDQLNKASDQELNNLWSQKQSDIKAKFSDPQFINNVDNKLHDVYKTSRSGGKGGYTLNNPNPIYDTDWKYRMTDIYKDIWNPSQSNNTNQNNTGNQNTNTGNTTSNTGTKTVIGNYKNGPRAGKDLIVSRIEGETQADFETRLNQTQKAATKDQNIFVEKPGGGYQRLKGKVLPSTEIKDERLGNLQRQYGQLEYLIKNNKDLQTDLFNEYKRRIDSYKSGLGAKEKEALTNLTQEQFIDIFLEGQKQNYAFNAAGVKIKGDPTWDTYPRNKKYNEEATKLGFTAFDDPKIRAFQAGYQAMQELADDPKYKDVLADYDVAPIGKPDQTYKGRPISPMDGIYGNTTAGQVVLPKSNKYALEDLEEEDKVEPYDIQPLDAQETGVSPARWWTQDVVNTLGSIGDIYSVNRYYPTLQTVNYELPSPTFVSPERALAANAEQANIAAQALGAFSGPQALSSRISNVQGKAAANAANIMDQVNKQNVGIANTFELTRKQIANEQNRQNAALTKQFYDETVATNQQYDDSTRALRQAARQNYVTGLTNAGQTAAMNAMYPHYQVDPTTGNVYFSRGSNFVPSSGYSKTPYELFKELRSDPAYADVSDDNLVKLVIKDSSYDQGYGFNPNAYPVAPNPSNTK